MAYIGQQPFQEFASVPTKDSFTGDGSTTTFDLANDVVRGGEIALEVFIIRSEGWNVALNFAVLELNIFVLPVTIDILSTWEDWSFTPLAYMDVVGLFCQRG